jgi:hypothetical protein
MLTRPTLRAMIRTIWFGALALLPILVAACSQQGGGGPAY